MTKELCLVERSKDGEIEYITALANDQEKYRNFVIYRVEKLSFDELSDKLKI